MAQILYITDYLIFAKYKLERCRSQVTIEFGKSLTGDVLVEIMSMGGQVFYNVNLKEEMLRDGRYTIDLGTQPRGIYLLLINKQVVKDKVVLQ